jgi:hypothetical protein
MTLREGQENIHIYVSCRISIQEQCRRDMMKLIKLAEEFKKLFHETCFFVKYSYQIILNSKIFSMWVCVCGGGVNTSPSVAYVVRQIYPCV